MTAPAPARPYTADEFLHMPENEGAELVDGQIVEVPMGSISSWIGGELLFLVRLFLRSNELGWVFPQETGMTIWPDRPGHVRKPDLVFVRKGRLPGGRPPAGWLTVVPDLVVEVVSPGDEIEAFEAKLDEYRAAGIPLIWVIYPGTRRAHVLGTSRPRTEIAPDGSLDGEDVLPGFSCKLAELFSAAERAD
ncbi:MAG: Uma2 family endonuclease [Dehalococcoidia bacterium]|nr:Uma2 family endonuclease [Dehalococcoidia bacterium]